MEWLSGLKVSDLPERYREMADLVGLENTVKLALRYAKQPLYFIDLEAVVTKKKKEYIIEHFKGNNHNELARATGYSSRWVYEILEEHKRLNAVKIKQKKLFTCV